MRRLHLFEFEDLPWFPSAVRDCMTDFLGFMGSMRHAALPYRGFAARLGAALSRTGDGTVVDLCSGTGGPALTIARLLEAEHGRRVRLVLTDLYPNVRRLNEVRSDTACHVEFSPQPVDAASVPESLRGFRLICNGFHHLAPERARACLQDAVDKRQGIAIAELVDRSPASLFLVAVGVSAQLAVTPFIRPWRARRFLFTYALPVAPLCTLWDGVVSCLRAYDVGELERLVQSLRGNDYDWEIGRLPVPKMPAKVTYLIGSPRRA